MVGHDKRARREKVISRYTASSTTTGTTDVWVKWNWGWGVDDCGTTGSSSAVTIWETWNAEILQTATNATGTWRVWNSEEECRYQQRMRAAYRYAEARAETPEMVEARRIEGERRAAEVRASQAILEAAKEKAEKLLQSALAPEQKEELKAKGYFHCKSKNGVLYRIRRGTHGNVRKLDPSGTKEVESLCIQPDNVPAQDAMLAQKLMIENDEDTFRRIANITRILN